MSLTSYLAAPSRDLTMRHAAWEVITTCSERSLQGKFCHCWKFVLFLWCNDFLPAAADTFENRMGGTRSRASCTGGAANFAGAKTAGLRCAESSGGFFISVLSVSIGAAGELATWNRGGAGVASDGGVPSPTAAFFKSLLFDGGWSDVCRPPASDRKGTRAIKMDLGAASGDAEPGGKLRVPRAARVGDGLPGQGGATREDDTAATATDRDRRSSGIAGDLLFAS